VPRKYQILVCKGPECGDKRHAADVHAAFVDALKQCPLAGNEVALDRYSCFGRCQRGVNVLVREIKPGENTRLLMMMPTAGPNAYLYHMVRPDEARRILEEHVAAGRPLLDLTRRAPPPS
jgi:(2Fe-2S) ferredoxin